ncbi:MAG TPA: hypothetical protein VED43_14350, partial [Mycobacterium sp.]|nr:hypothetical protein [Mycobacterium sp.]
MLAAGPKRGFAGSDTNHKNAALISQPQEGSPMEHNRVLVTGATGKIGGAVAAQLLEKGVP